MTDATWTFDQLKNEFRTCQTVGELFATIEKQVSDRGEVICELRLNGKIVEDDQDQSLRTQPVSVVEKLAIRSDRPEALIQGALESVLLFIPGLVRSCAEVADQLRQGMIHEGSNQLQETLGGCQWLVETLHHARGAANGIRASISSVERWHQNEKNFISVMGELTATFDRQDLPLAADILEYDLTAAIELCAPVVADELDKRARK